MFNNLKYWNAAEGKWGTFADTDSGYMLGLSSDSGSSSIAKLGGARTVVGADLAPVRATFPSVSYSAAGEPVLTPRDETFMLTSDQAHGVLQGVDMGTVAKLKTQAEDVNARMRRSSYGTLLGEDW